MGALLGSGSQGAIMSLRKVLAAVAVALAASGAGPAGAAPAQRPAGG